MNYLSVCSGIEAATCAWHPLGWTPAAFSEIEPFPSAVLTHHYPTVPNLGDMTKFKEWPDYAIDLVVGGTPCQSFSVAGLRKGLADPRGNLMLTYLAIADKYRPRWLVWENVPGVLSSNGGKDFGTFLGGLAELGYGFAYRVFDAQYIRVESHARAVPQRRRRVFVVGYLGDWRRAAAVLFERESLCGHSAPRREAGKVVAGTFGSRTGSGGGFSTDFECDGGLVPSISKALLAGGQQKQDAELETLIPIIGGGFDVAHSLRGEGFDASEDGTGRGTPLIPIAIQAGALRENPDSGPDGIGVQEAIAYTLEARAEVQAICFDTTQITSPTNRSNPQPGDPRHSLSAHSHPPSIAFDCKASGQNGFGVGEIASTLRAMGHAGSHQNGGGHLAVAFDMRGRDGGAQFEGPHETANIRAASGGSSKSYVATEWAVRRLTPLECERLQGFPDQYTNILVRGKPAADGPRYKALGNSMAVNAMRHIGNRIQVVECLAQALEVAA